MSQFSVSALKRDSAGKGVARKLRAKGLIPGVLYGRDSSPILFSTDEKAFATLMKEQGLNSILELDIEGDKHTCMIAEYQKDVFQRNLTHIDLKMVDLNAKVVVRVPVALEGEQSVRGKGGIAQLYARELKVRVLATEIPKRITFDISELNPGESRKLSAVTLPDNVEALDPMSTTVVNVLAPRALAAARAAASK